MFADFQRALEGALSMREGDFWLRYLEAYKHMLADNRTEALNIVRQMPVIGYNALSGEMFGVTKIIENDDGYARGCEYFVLTFNPAAGDIGVVPLRADETDAWFDWYHVLFA